MRKATAPLRGPGTMLGLLPTAATAWPPPAPRPFVGPVGERLVEEGADQRERGVVDEEPDLGPVHDLSQVPEERGGAEVDRGGAHLHAVGAAELAGELRQRFDPAGQEHEVEPARGNL